MKVVKEKAEGLKTYSIQMHPSVMKHVDEAAGKADVSRQKFIEAVLSQVLADPKFVLRIKE